MNTVIRTAWWQGSQRLNYTVRYRKLGEVVRAGKWTWGQKMSKAVQTHAHTRRHTLNNNNNNKNQTGLIKTFFYVCLEIQRDEARWLELSTGAWPYLPGDPEVHDPLCDPVPLASPSNHAIQVHPGEVGGDKGTHDVTVAISQSLSTLLYFACRTCLSAYCTFTLLCVLSSASPVNT